MGSIPSQSLATLAHCEVSHIPPANLFAEKCGGQGTGMWTRRLGAAYNDAKAVRPRSAKEWNLAHKR